MNMLNLKRISLPILAMATVAASGVAQAATVIVTGAGSVDSTAVSRGGNATIDAAGAPVSFLAQFDPATATLLDTDPLGTTRVYDLATVNLAATIGGHSLNFDSTTLERAILIVGTAFAFFGGTASEAVLNETFQFTAGPGGATSPVRLNRLPPTREILSFSYTFRTGSTTVPATIDSLRDPTEAARGIFFYFADTGNSGSPAARASGPATGALEVVSPVPEPGTWALMILGLFMTGAMLRRRRAALAGFA